ncbi:MAG: 3'(2'),5'-bisphosphate nucleotidase CysQ [Xanthobacteraceae bacterium]|nr:3'(2'),5'-bisphosphate nucleotidase CysQ [Xanthobacteraceae bacterium]
MNALSRDELAFSFAATAVAAGKIIMSARDASNDVEHKADGSPVTRADREADDFIRAQLAAALPGVCAITEETFERTQHHNNAASLDRFVLVDPLDGTREFVAGRDEFTVNIALIEAGRPVVGAVYAPAMSLLYMSSARAYRVKAEPGDGLPARSTWRELKTSPAPAGGLRAVASRSHLDPDTRRWLEERKIASVVSAGSSLKFCTVAEGQADVYPRFGPTMEWDTAAGHAILEAAGGCVLGLDGSPLCYGTMTAAFRNSAFVAWGRAPVS